MMSTKRLIALLTIASCLAVTARGQQLKPESERRAENPLERSLCDASERDCSTFYDVFGDDDIWEVLYLSLPALDLTGGVAFLKGEDGDQRYSFSPKSLKLRDLLDGIVAVEPRYRWEIEEGSINLLPVEDYKLLGQPISEFKMENATVQEMIDALKQRPEFKRALAELKLSEPPEPSAGDENGFAISMAIGRPREQKKRFSLERKNGTVRQILNEMVRTAGCGLWSYHEWDWRDSAGTERRYFKLGLMEFCS